MQTKRKFRCVCTVMLALWLACPGVLRLSGRSGWSGSLFGSPLRQARAQRPAPPPPPRSAPARPGQKPPNQHLAQWLQSHKDLTPEQQQSALESEPGFHELPAATQQRMRDRLAQLNAMPQQQRDRVLQRTEQMERLAPEQRQQVRGAMAQWNSLPPDRRQAVGRAFRQLRAMPEGERAATVNSPQFRSQFSREEQGTLNNLLQVEPLLPPPGGGQH